MTKTAFLAAYRAHLVTTYGAGWAADTAKLDRFMKSVEATISFPKSSSPWHHKGDCVTAAWRAIGGKGTPTLKALRELPA